MAPSNARVSVVVPTCNRSDRAVRLVDALAAQDFDQPFEVVFVDDVSRDDTLERLRALAPSQPFAMSVLPSNRNTGPAGARNRGWNAARGELIAFTDDDCVPDKGWLSALVAGLEQADVVIGSTRPPAEQLHLIGPFSHYLDIDHNKSFSTCNIGYRRSVLTAMEGFDAEAFRWPNGEDTDLGLRAVKAGYRDDFAADALVWHDVAPSNFRNHLHRVPRLDGLVALVERHPEARQNMQAGMFLRSIDKAVLIAWAAIFGLLARPRSRATRLLAVVAVLLYVWQHDKNYFKAHSVEEWAKAVPLGFVADSWAVLVMIRSSIRYKTLLL